MQKSIKNPGSKQSKRFEKSESLELQERTRFQLILLRGFGEASGYNLNRNRYEVELKEGVTETELFNFCIKHLKGSPFPSPGPSSGTDTLEMFKAAEKAGLVVLKHVVADRFIPEAGCIR